MFTEPKDESELEQFVKVEAMNYNCTLMRNNSGACVDATGRLVRYGLGNISPKQQIASSDEIGITRTLVTQEMVGTYVGIFTALEIKHPKWKPTKKFDTHEIKQLNFINWVRQMGGIAGFVNSVDNLKDIFRK